MTQQSSIVKYIGVDDHAIDLFEGQYRVPRGMSYNSYLVCDRLTAVMDTVDRRFITEWLRNIEAELGDRAPDFLVVHHMEPDHSSGIKAFMDKYPASRIVASAKAYTMMKQFFGTDFADRAVTAGEGFELELGEHKLSFITAPMVHWPEVIMSFLSDVGALFSADAFGKFGSLDARQSWDDESRRYYFGIVGKYGAQVGAVLKKAASLPIKIICPLHGPALEGDLSHYLDLYNTWSQYLPEEEGITVAFTSVYGHTRVVAEQIAETLRLHGETVSVYDLSRDDMASAVADAFRFDRLLLATTTYNMEMFPPMRTFLEELAERGFKNRTVGLIENGTWAPAAAKKMAEKLGTMKDITILSPTVTIRSTLDQTSQSALDELSGALQHKH